MTDLSNRKKTQAVWAGWLIFGVSLLVNVAAIVLLILNPQLPITPGWGIRGFPTILSLSFSSLGMLILSRYPHHRIGWLFGIAGFVSGFQALFQEYSFYAVFGNSGLQASGEVAAWIVNWIWVPLNALFVFIFVLYPDGKLPSRRWRTFIWVSIVMLALLTLSMAFTPGPLESSIMTVENPFGIGELEKYFDAISLGTSIGFVFVLLGAFGALLQRYRRSARIERQQLKWFLYGVALMALFSPTAGLVFPWHLAFMAVMIFLPVAAAIAILRYRLYDIDIIIRRTLQYTLLTGILALLYFGGIILLQAGVGALTEQTDSPVITVLTTLGIAALFNPLRHRVQDFIDRRFYRKKYNAEQALARFASVARDEVDMDKLTTALIGVVEETVQPERVSLWLRSSDSAPKRVGMKK